MKKIVLLLIAIFLISCNGTKKEEVIANEKTIILDTTKIANQEKSLSEQQKFLKENGFKYDSEFSKEQFEEFKGLIKSGVFKEKSFCDVYKETLNLQGKELKKYISKYKKIKYFDTLLFMYGPKVCEMSSVRENYSKEYYVNTDESNNACIIAKDFIKKDLYNPSTADFSVLDCSAEQNTDGSYTVMRKVSAQNSLGVEREFIYKLRIGFKGGEWTEISNWTLIKIQSEEYR